MTLNHVTLAVPEVALDKAFLIDHFGLRDGGGTPGIAFLHDDGGLLLTLIKAKEVVYPAIFHIGFIQPSEARVDAINARLREAGFEVAPPKRTHGYTFYVKAPGGYLVEVLA